MTTTPSRAATSTPSRGPVVVHRLGAVDVARRMGESHPPTSEQVATIEAPLAPYALIAGAGSGKTQTMGLRVVWLVANGLVEPHRVLGLTFTRKAAAQLGDRVRRMLRQLLAAHAREPFLADEVAAALRAGEPTVSTYSAYAASLVAEHALRVGVEPSARLIGEAVTWQYAAEIVSAYDGPMEAVDKAFSTVTADVLTLAGELSEHLVTPDGVRRLSEQVSFQLRGLPSGRSRGSADAPKDLRDFLTALDARCALLPMVERYAELKRSRSAMDYGDQVALAARIARDHAEVSAAERIRYGAVLLDEYQDTGEAQRVLLTSLFGGRAEDLAVTAVGDPRQSIYGWRGASAGNLERFSADFPAVGGGPGASSGLTASFRNGERILAVANAISRTLPIRTLGRASLHAAPATGQGQVVPAVLDSVEDEARWIAERVSALRGDVTWGEVAVLARKRSAFPLLEAALRERGVPCEVIGLGGLLLEPEVVDLVSTLRVLADPSAGNAVVRLLTGPRWRLGPRDLAMLGRRARRLAARLDARANVDPEPDVVDDRSLVDALDDLGDPGAYSAEGHRRLAALRDELRELRRWTAQPLPDLVGQVARTLGLDVELAARPGIRPGDALVSVDRFVEVAEEFAAAEDNSGLISFLAYLDAAEEREDGLDVDVAEPDADRVQLMTVHAAKGLEWDVVAVAGMVDKVFPVQGQAVTNWVRQAAILPFPLRGDRSDLPALDLGSALDSKAAANAVKDFGQRCKDRAQLEERRLAYVATTRARRLLLCTGYWWDSTITPRGPSSFLREIREVCDELGQPCGPWADPPGDGAENPLTSRRIEAEWPTDPLGARRPELQAAADLVRAAAPVRAAGSVRAAEPARGAERSRTDPPMSPPKSTPELGRRPDQWSAEADLLLAEHLRRPARVTSTVQLPGHLSVSQLVQLRRNPAELARQIRRPLPARPQPLARRGTRFHLWLEQRWGQQRLLDVDELPGAADATAEPDADLAELRDAFARSTWSTRVPAEVEFPFDMVVEGVVLRGRIDAVFSDDPQGYVDVVDWKTGARPRDSEADAAAVQLAAYRLAWAALTGTAVERVRAAFHYVRSDETVRPADLLDADTLAELIRAVPLAESGS